MSQTNPALAAIFEFVKQLANFALDHAQALTQNPAPWAVDVGGKTVRTFYGAIYGTVTSAQDVQISSTERVAFSFRRLRFEPSGIRELMRDLLLQPSPDLPNKIEGNINENVEPLIQAQKEALSNPAIVLHNKKLIDKIQGIVTLEEAFHQLVDTDCRWYREILCAYVTDPNSVSINERQAMAHELDLLFDGLNAEVSAALETIEAMFVPDALQRAGIFVPIR